MALVWTLLLGSALADTCSQIESAYTSCQLSSMCSQCIATSDCEYDLMDGTCTSSVASNSSTTYCSATDSVCSSCTVSSTKPTCTGNDGSCICPSLCDIVSSAACSSNSNSDDSPKFSMLYLVVAFGALGIMIMLYMQRRCKEKRREHHISLVRQELESMREQRQREREYLRSHRPELALDLGTWRESVETHKPQMSKVELETCYYLMVQDEKKKKSQKSNDNASDGEDKSPSGLPATIPYVEMREEYPSNTTTAASDSASESASVVDEDEEKPDIAIGVEHSDARR
ncbi:hypothetical protein PHMEG_000382 [Phytophthora megakarya]|uniref:Uncharacterized protein n=1 Tax=Phytophthora megakarya TaxID=4795 RepID=A0A225X5K1_9STRA|nr:hypothetical protein PHMEG_000382 [Phytophthora megakarya]